MKKLFALLLCAVMLFSMVAVAEEAQDDAALVALIHNIVLESGAEGEVSQIALDGLEVYVSIDTSDGAALILQAFNGDDSLALAVLKLVGTQLRIGIDGVDKTFVQDIPALAGQDTAALGEMIRPVLPTLLNARLPMMEIPGMQKLGLISLAAMFGTEAEDGSVSFSVPHEMVDTLLDQLLEIGKSAADSIPGAGEALALVQQLRDSGMSVAFEGSVVDSGDQELVSVGIYPVSEDQTAESPAAVLNLTSAQDALSLTLDIPTEDSTVTVADLEVQTDTAANACYATLDIAGELQFNLGAYQEDGLQKVALTVEGNAETAFALTMSYGKSGENDVMDISFGAGENAAFEISSTTSAVSEDATAGSVDISLAFMGSQFHLAADVEEFIGNVDLGDYVMPAATATLDEMSNEENSAALQAALEPLIGYLSQVFTDTAA